MTVIYRISDSGYAKRKPTYINNENCLSNARRHFPHPQADWIIIADNVKNRLTRAQINSTKFAKVIETSIGHGAGSFNVALDEALKLKDAEIIYFLENDYIHREGSLRIITEAIQMGGSYVTLYLHPDKFLPPEFGGNINASDQGGYSTTIYRGTTQIFALFDSTTMTFAAKVETLRADEAILREYTSSPCPKDFLMFRQLCSEGRTLIGPLESYATHGESRWLAPLSGISAPDLEKSWGDLIFR